MSEHTPGPWVKKREGWSTIYIEGRIRPGVIQEVAACGPTEAGEDQQEANARLIAAAPELLEALEDIVADFGICGITEKARSAIAKATGESE